MRIRSSVPIVAVVAVTALACGETSPEPTWPKADATGETAAVTPGLVAAFRGVSVPPFDGSPVAVAKTVPIR